MPAEKPLSRSNVTACARCRRRKQRCDQKFPKCKACEKAGTECVSIDAATKKTVPRSYIHSLEERVVYLENRLSQHEGAGSESTRNDDVVVAGEGSTHRTPDDASPDATGSNYPGPFDNSFPNNRDETRRQAANIVSGISNRLTIESPIGSSLAGTLLNRLYQAEAVRDMVSPAQDSNSFVFESLQADLQTQIEYPSAPVAEHLIKVFFELCNLSAPILHEVTFREKYLPITADSQTTPPSPMSSFFTHIVFTIALLVLQRHDAANIPTSLCDRHFAAALRSLESTSLPANIEGVQALLLIAFYSYLHPKAFHPWRTVGMALRLAVEIRLHRDGSAESNDALTLDTRRRVFWVAYSMDRTIGTTLGRPFALSDGAIDCQLPSPVDDKSITSDGIADGPIGTKAFGLHYIRYRQLQSEIQVMLHETRPWWMPGIDFALWQAGMHDRLSQWLSSQPTGGSSSIVAPSEALGLAYHQAVIQLYRPSQASSQASSPASEESLDALAESASQTIQIYQRLHHECRFRLFWQASHNLFAAGTALLHCYVHSPKIRQQMTLRSLESRTRACSSMLWAMSERFPAASGKRDAFDTISTAALDSLSGDTPSAGELADNLSGGGNIGGVLGGAEVRWGDQSGLHIPTTSEPFVERQSPAGSSLFFEGLETWPGNSEEIPAAQIADVTSLDMDVDLLPSTVGVTTWL